MQDSRPKHSRQLESEDVISSFYWKKGAQSNLGSRKEQQDDYGMALGTYKGKPTLLAVLADGMGGMKNGAQFSWITVEYLMKNFQDALDTGLPPASVLLTLAHGANKEAHKIYDEEKPGGTTLIAGMFVEDQFYMLSVGDSRIYLFRKHNVVNKYVPLQLNREHVLGPSLDERAWMGKISFEDAEENLYRDSLISGIGSEKIRRIDLPLNPIRLQTGDKIVFMSDGIYRSLSEEEIAADLAFSPDKASDEIIRHVLEKKMPHQDNMSVIIVERIVS